MDIHDVDRREVLRYLGYRGQEADEAVTAMVEQSMAELGRHAQASVPGISSDSGRGLQD